MEEVLDVYQAQYDAKLPLISMDETSRQLLSDVFDPLPIKPGWTVVNGEEFRLSIGMVKAVRK